MHGGKNTCKIDFVGKCGHGGSLEDVDADGNMILKRVIKD
jgi:hypothetical protein